MWIWQCRLYCYICQHHTHYCLVGNLRFCAPFGSIFSFPLFFHLLLRYHRRVDTVTTRLGIFCAGKAILHPWWQFWHQFLWPVCCIEQRHGGNHSVRKHSDVKHLRVHAMEHESQQGTKHSCFAPRQKETFGQVEDETPSMDHPQVHKLLSEDAHEGGEDPLSWQACHGVSRHPVHVDLLEARKEVHNEDLLETNMKVFAITRTPRPGCWKPD